MFPLKQNRKALFWLSHSLPGRSIPQHLRNPSPCMPGPLFWRPVPSPCRTRWCWCRGPRVRGHAVAQQHALPHVLQSWQCRARCRTCRSFQSHVQPPKRAACGRFYSCIQPRGERNLTAPQQNEHMRPPPAVQTRNASPQTIHPCGM